MKYFKNRYVFNKVLNYKGNEIENFKKQNEELDIPLNYETHLENRIFSVEKYIGNKKNNKYEGRCILYGKNDNIIFNGYLKMENMKDLEDYMMKNVIMN